MSGISLLFGIGNPGAEYRHTRHNIGIDTIAFLAARLGLSWETRATVRRSVWRRGGRKIDLVQSRTYMNESGTALSSCRPSEPGGLIVICDCIHLPVGRIRIRAAGGSGGHRGLESIAEALGTEDFPRLRMGVGTPAEADWSDYVLSPFGETERPVSDEMIRAAADALEVVVIEGLGEAMRRFNRKDAAP
jgi:PTH1 family peptidyl-tRNA hydrolase